MAKEIVIGGGSAGIVAAACARKAGAEVTVSERQDQLLGIGRIAGSMDVGSRYPLHLEILEMGAPEVNIVLDGVALINMENYRRSHYPWHSLPGSEEMTKHSSVYNVLTAEPALRKLLVKMGVEFVRAAG
jgi:monoamine oxidase